MNVSKFAVRLKKFLSSFRHSKKLRALELLFRMLKPVYEAVMNLIFFSGCPVLINKKYPVRFAFLFCDFPNNWEPDVFEHLMSGIRPSDTIVEVGGFIGVYTVPMAKRLSQNGKILVFEPEPVNYKYLKLHISMNKVADNVFLHNIAISDQEGSLYFKKGGYASSFGTQEPIKNTTKVSASALDSVIENQKVDLLKIDVEGFEENILRSASQLLQDPKRCPREIYIEMHPQFWGRRGTTSKSILSTLSEFDYKVFDLKGDTISEIVDYGEVIARKM